MPPTELLTAERPVRVLVVTHDPHLLPDLPSDGRWELTAVVPPGSGPVPQGYAVEQVEPTPAVGWRAGVRSVATATRSAQVAVVHGAPLRWVWALKRSQRFRQLVRDQDVLVHADPATGRILSMMPQVVGDIQVLPADQSAALSAVRDVLVKLAGGPAAAGEEDGKGDGNGETAAVLVEELTARLGELRAEDLPDRLRLPDAVASIVRHIRERRGLLVSSQISFLLDAPRCPGGADLASGARARWLSAALTLGHRRPDVATDADLDTAVQAALRGADAALQDGHEQLALDRLTDAMILMFHRARHAETTRSPLVDDPGRFLAPLRANATFTELLRRRPDRVARPAPPQDRQIRALVVGGAYGDFHLPVAAALDGQAEVRVRDLGKGHLRRTVLTPGTLPRLAQLLATREGATRLGRDPESEPDLRAQQMLGHLRWADVVFADWADPATVWLTHLCPRRVRLVLRVHAVDALEPWIHLVRWTRVDHVVVVSEPMRSLVEDLLLAMGVRRPVTVLPNLIPACASLDRPKDPGARTTLGLIGWGRQVKDPLWALRLVRRDPDWHLVLVGPAFPDPPAPHQADYVRQVRELLAAPDLRDRVRVLGPTDDVGVVLRQVGVILSTSRRESWHLGLVEGALSRAVPVVRNWPLLAARGGPRALFPDDWVVEDLDEAERRVRAVTSPHRWEWEGERARAVALELFDPEEGAQAYRRLVLDLVRSGQG